MKAMNNLSNSLEVNIKYTSVVIKVFYLEGRDV